MNRLQHETSPYLRQHMHNPVDWYPWGPEALELARSQDRPILLSVGYSACHWCHVMERESFEEPAIAEWMNAHFVNVKVDREERPDLDELYMRAVQAFTGGHGGWPMTVFLTPTGEPYFGGTYFPPLPRGRMPSFPQVLQHAHKLYTEHREELSPHTSKLLEHLHSSGRLPAPEGRLRGDWLELVSRGLAEHYDEQHGGFGGPPKFPPCGSLAVLLAHHALSGDAESLRMARGTLDGMARGGMYDHLAGGFARYSVDTMWQIPHFEKMLYDNGQLVPLYLDAHLLTGSADYARVAADSLDWLLREMQLPGGAFASATDADTEGLEGSTFVWTPGQLVEALGAEDGARLAELCQVTDDGNFEHGHSVLRLESPRSELPQTDRELLDRCFPVLLARREGRPQPARDDKVVTAWNGLAVRALARGSQVLGEPRYLEAAADAADFLLTTVTVDGRLHRTWKDDRVGPTGFLDDHANLIAGLIELWHASFEPRWLRAAEQLAERMVELFWDPDEGGFFTSGHDAERLISRSKAPIGGALPSGNGVAAWVLANLALLLDRPDWAEAAERVVLSYQPILERASRALGFEALAGAFLAGSPLQIGLVGEDPEELLSVVRGRLLPQAVLACGPGLADLDLPWLRKKGTPDGRATAWVCERGACQIPTRDPETLRRQLGG
jgi:uncharacterized protein YyaL (SSP411 family)